MPSRVRGGTPERPVLPRVVALLTPYRGHLALAALTILVGAALGAIPPFLTQALFDRALFPPDGSVDMRLLTWLVLALVAVPLASSGIGVAQTFLTTLVGNRAMADLRARLFEHLGRMELAFFTSTRTGTIQSRLANDIGGVRSVLTTTAAGILASIVTIIASIVAMTLLSWQLTLVSLVLMPVFILLQRRIGARSQVLARETQESLSELTAITQEALSISGVLLAKIFNRAEAEVARYRAESEHQVDLQVHQAMVGQWFFGMVTAFMAATPAIVYLTAGVMIGDGTVAVTAGTLVAFSTLQARVLMPTITLMRVTLDIQASLALFRRIFEYLDLVPALRDRTGAVELSAPLGEVCLGDVWFAYPAPTAIKAPIPKEPNSGRSSLESGADPRPWALEGVSLTVRPGQLAALVGPSGAGKTTLMYLVPRLYEVDCGVVRIDGIDVRDLTLSSVADTVGMVTQDPYLFHASIADNLRYAQPNATDADLVDAARAANIHDRITALPGGYATIVGERGYRLSGGEKQRLAIARVLLKDPRILLLDEATSALDTVNERLVQRALARVMAGRTTIAIAHRLSTVQHADVIAVMDAGRIVEVGGHAELIASGGLYSRLHAEQFGGGLVEGHFADGVLFTDGKTMP